MPFIEINNIIEQFYIFFRKRSKRDKATPEVVYRNEEDEASTPMIMANGHGMY